ncbi:hypothetical protein FNV43_RR01252 [Rhamnella rubrinervis]|uniref:Pentatricopeptide repeat-containing protein n=1 Tax=Rhamnella rubrinervis TaxID=2594499 RepID=A0A8K0HS45_9ROSA|nr:hypothetical protein FNV43_RR01252 [Rhamnella rubrinervis]
MIDCGTLPDVVTYNTLLDALCKEGRTAEAINLVEAMTNTDVKFDIFIYNSLVYGLSPSGQWRDATSLLDKMKDQRMLLNAYTALIDSLCKEEKAISLFELMIRRGIKPEFITFNSLISGLCKSGELKKAAQFLNNMIEIVRFNDSKRYALANKKMTGKAYETFEVVIQHLKSLTTT